MDICDFCDSKNVVCRYDCMDFDSASRDAGVMPITARGAENVVLVSKNFWAACQPCRELIEKEDIDGLVARAVGELDRQGNLTILGRAFFISHLRHTYRLFFESRIRVAGAEQDPI